MEGEDRDIRPDPTSLHLKVPESSIKQTTPPPPSPQPLRASGPKRVAAHSGLGSSLQAGSLPSAVSAHTPPFPLRSVCVDAESNWTRPRPSRPSSPGPRAPHPPRPRGGGPGRRKAEKRARPPSGHTPAVLHCTLQTACFTRVHKEPFDLGAPAASEPIGPVFPTAAAHSPSRSPWQLSQHLGLFYYDFCDQGPLLLLLCLVEG